MTPFETNNGAISHDEEENYFVSMTDMMVGVLFIFIIMLMVFALDFREQTDEQERLSRERLETLEEAERELEKAKAAQEAAERERERLRKQNEDLARVTAEVARKLEELRSEVRAEIDVLAEQQRVRSSLLQDIREELRKNGLLVEIDETNGVLRLTEDAVGFPTDRSDLVGDARRNVMRIATALAAVLPQYTPCTEEFADGECQNSGDTTVETVFIEGHTDQTGSDSRNWQLSAERAVSTYRAIEADEPSLVELRNRAGRQIISVSGYADRRPISSEVSSEAYARNRRIDLRFVMETDKRGRLDEILQLTDDMQDQIEALRRVSGQ